MLNSLIIKNFAIIENTSLSFDSGFNVLIGETGAGKSIILDALNFVLGGKASKEFIRHNTTEMSVKASFSDVGKEALKKLTELNIEVDDILIISRTFTNEGKSSCLVNGEPVTVSMLKQLGDLLYDIYGQHDGLEILNSKNHLKMLDSFDPKSLLKFKSEIKEYLEQYKQIDVLINELGGQDENRERTLDLLSYQINEIESLNIKVNEDIDLENQIATLSNFEKISNALSSAYDTINNSELTFASTYLNNASNYDTKIEDLSMRLNSCLIDVEDIASSIKDYLSNMSYSEAELDKLNDRFEKIKAIKKKYGPTINDVNDYLDKTKTLYGNILNSEEKLKELESKQHAIKNELYRISSLLHEKREEIAKIIECKIQDELKLLGMNNTAFKVQFNSVDKQNCKYTQNGFDQVEFLFSANLGEKQKSLAKTISGGEMSRFMLAIKSILNNSEDENLLVFDEIDSGVSGEIGYKVGQKLAKLALKYQIICITHLPQVTALADKFIYIKKETQDNQTKSKAIYLNRDQVTSYIASLFGSYESKTGYMHANELIEMASAFKQSLNK